VSDLFLTDDQLSALTPAELAQYQALLERLDDEWTLHPKQARAEAEAAEVDEVLFGGAAGGGKTDWMLYHAHGQCQRYAGYKVLALRRTFPQLKDSLIRRSLEKFRDKRVCKYMVGEKEWRYANGSTIRFGFCDTDEDVRHYLSTEYDLIVFEELTEFTERQYMLVRSRNRTTARQRAAGVRPHTIAATNPGQVGHTWVKRRFVLPTDYGEHRSEQVVEAYGRRKKATVAFVPAKVSDNPSMDPDYVFNLAQLPDIERRQYLDGDWDVFEGQFFTEFDRAAHVVAPFAVPEEWTRITGVDYGFGKPFCCLWVAIDWDANAWVYRELYGPGLTATAQGRRMAEASVLDNGKPERHYGRYADPSVWTRQGHGISIAAMYRDAGFGCKKAMNARRDGWSRVRDYLRGDGSLEGGSSLRIFETCTNLIRTIPEMIFDRTDAEDLDTKLEDHAVDALRYALMARPPRKRRAPERLNDPDVDDYLDELVRSRARGDKHPVLGRMTP
jgi:phage terminase large subunit